MRPDDPKSSPRGPDDYDARKASVYLPADAYEELRRQAARLDRSVSWVMQQAWRVARQHLRSAPSHKKNEPS